MGVPGLTGTLFRPKVSSQQRRVLGSEAKRMAPRRAKGCDLIPPESGTAERVWPRNTILPALEGAFQFASDPGTPRMHPYAWNGRLFLEISLRSQ